MKTKVLEFPKTRRNPEYIQDKVSEILKEYNLIYVSSAENQNNNKMVLTLLLTEYLESDAKVKVKIIRNTRNKDAEAAINKFINKKDLKLRFFNQAVFNNTIVSMIFYTDTNPKGEDKSNK